MMLLLTKIRTQRITSQYHRYGRFQLQVSVLREINHISINNIERRGCYLGRSLSESELTDIRSGCLATN